MSMPHEKVIGDFQLPYALNANPAPAPRRRADLRIHTLLSGIITNRKGECSDCTIRNISKNGARISVERSQVPDEFYLIHIRERVAFEAKVEWRQGYEIGLSFSQCHPLNGDLGSELLFLKRIWFGRATV